MASRSLLQRAFACARLLSAGGTILSANAWSAPVVLITSPDENTYITTANYEEFTLTGFCSENGRPVTLSGPRLLTTTCSANAWTITQDMSFFFDATYTFTASHSSVSGEQAVPHSRTFIKDTIPPFNNRIVINGGQVPTSTQVTLTLSSTSAADMYITNTAGCTAGGQWRAFATTVPWTLAPIGSTATVYAMFRDGVGNRSSCLSASTRVEIIAAYPSLSFTSPAPNSFVSAANAGAFPVSGTCSENSGNVQLSGPVSLAVACVNSLWSATLDLTAAPEGALVLQASHGNTSGLSSTAALDLLKDTVAPVLTIAPFSAGSFAHLANQSAFPVSGTCSENGRDVALSALQVPAAAQALGKAVCAQGAWSLVADLTALAQGTATLVASQSDGAGNTGASAGRSLTKDTVAPSIQSVAINQGAAITNSLAATVSVSATDAIALRLTPAAGCAPGAAFGPYLAQNDVTLEPAADTAWVYAQVKDEAGNLSACVGDSIVIDTVPAQVTIAASGAFINAAQALTFAVGGTCSEAGREVTVDGAASGAVLCSAGRWSLTLDLSAIADGAVALTAHHVDLAGNAALPSTLRVTKDTVAPTGTIQIAGGAAITSQASVELSLASTDGAEMYVTGSAGCTTGGAWEPLAARKNWTLGQLNSVATVYAAFRDAAGNAGACVSDTIVHDNVAPEAPVFTRAEPALGSPIPVFFGTAPSADTQSVALHADAACATAPLGVSDPATFAANGIAVTLPQGATVPVYARAADGAGLLSACALLTQYVRELPPLVISPATATLASDSAGSIQFSASGGQSPYRFDVISGEGTIDAVTGRYDSAAGAAGRALVQVTDQGGKTAQASVTHVQALALQVDGAVRAIAVDPQGNRYLGGSFGRFGGKAVTGMIALDPSGNVADGTAFGSGFDGPVLVARPTADGGLLVGGAFTRYQGVLVNGLVKLSPQGALDSAFLGATAGGMVGFDGAVRAIAAGPGGEWYVGGEFTSYRGRPAQRLVKLQLDGNADAAFAPEIPENGTSGVIHALAVQGTGLLIGGEFDRYRGAAAGNLARVSTVDGALDPVFNPSDSANGADGAVYALAADADAVYAGGAFRQYRGMASAGLVKILAGGVPVTGFNAGLAMAPSSKQALEVRALALSESALYVGGRFDSYGGSSAKNVLKLSLNGAGDPLFNSAGGTDDPVLALSLRGETLYATGAFRKFGANPANGFAGIHAVNGKFTLASRADEAGFSKNAGVPSLSALAVSVDGARIFVGGDAVGALYGGTARRGLIRLAPGGAVDGAFLAANALNGDVNAIAIVSDGLYLGGSFSSVAGKTAKSFAKLSFAGTPDLTVSPQSGQNGFDRDVWAITVSGNSVYVGGDFSKYRGAWANGLARLSLAGVQDGAFGKDATNGRVSSLAVGDAGATLYLGGQFNLVRKLDAHRVARVPLSTGVPDPVFNFPDGAFGLTNGTNNDVRAIALDPSSSRIYVAGRFNRYRGTQSGSVIRLNADGSVDSTFAASPDGDVRAIAVSPLDGRVYLGGSFAHVNGKPAALVASVDATGAPDPLFHPAGAAESAPVSGAVEAIAIDGDSLLIGGEFNSYRQQPVQNWTVLNRTDGNVK